MLTGPPHSLLGLEVGPGHQDCMAAVPECWEGGKDAGNKRQCSSHKYFLELKEWNGNKAWEKRTEAWKPELGEDSEANIA